MKKILVLSYFFPPSNKAGTRRLEALARYLPCYGWQPVFVAPERGYYGRLARMASNPIISAQPHYRCPFIYPANHGGQGWEARWQRRICEQLLFPDGKVTWNFSLRRHLPYLVKRVRPQAIWITGSPFSTFLLAPFCRYELGLPVILDYRDPWFGNPGVVKGSWKMPLVWQAEQRCLQAASLVTTASYWMRSFIQQHTGLPKELFFAFPYGYVPYQPRFSTMTPVVTFAGQIHGNICPENILKGIAQVYSRSPWVAKKLRFTCYGTLFGIPWQQAQKWLRMFALKDKIEVLPFLPLPEYFHKLAHSAFLLLPHGNDTITRLLYPTKLFDYLACQRPILYLGGATQVAETISACQAGICVGTTASEIAHGILQMFACYQQNSWYQSPEYAQLRQERLVAGLCQRLNSLHFSL